MTNKTCAVLKFRCLRYKLIVMASAFWGLVALHVSSAALAGDTVAGAVERLSQEGVTPVQVRSVGRCLAEASGDGEEGASVLVQRCNGSMAQRWLYDPDEGVLRSFLEPTRCVKPVNGVVNGGQLSLQECASSTDSMKWTHDSRDRLRAVADYELVLSVDSSRRSVTLSRDRDSSGQHWGLTESKFAVVGPYYIESELGNCLDDSSVGRKRYANVHLWDCHGGGNQQWYIGTDNTLRSALDINRCLDVAGRAHRGANVRVEPCEGSDYRWKFINDDKEVQVVGANGLVLDVDEPDSFFSFIYKVWSPPNGTNIGLWRRHGGKNQRWIVSSRYSIEFFEFWEEGYGEQWGSITAAVGAAVAFIVTAIIYILDYLDDGDGDQDDEDREEDEDGGDGSDSGGVDPVVEWEEEVVSEATPLTVAQCESEYRSTDPDLAVNMNRFDWRTRHYKMLDQEGAVSTVRSPYYWNNTGAYPFAGGKEVVENIAIPEDRAADVAQGEEVPDFLPLSGWELVKVNLGYHDLPDDYHMPAGPQVYPYVMLYHRYTGRLRVLIHTFDLESYNYLGVSLRVEGDSALEGVGREYVPKLLRHGPTRSLVERPANEGVEKTALARIVPATGWAYADFTVDYDPLVAYTHAEIELRIQPVLQGEIEMYGRSVGTTRSVQLDELVDPRDFLQGFSSDGSGAAMPGTLVARDLGALKEIGEEVVAGGAPEHPATRRLRKAGKVLGVVGTGASPFAGTSVLLGAIGAGLNSAAYFLEGEDSAPVNKYQEVMPQIEYAEMVLKGSVNFEGPRATYRLRVPGSPRSGEESIGHTQEGPAEPRFDGAMGVLNLLDKPTVKRLELNVDRMESPLYLGYAGTRKHEFIQIGKLPLVWNPDSGIDPEDVDIHVAFSFVQRDLDTVSPCESCLPGGSEDAYENRRARWNGNDVVHVTGPGDEVWFDLWFQDEWKEDSADDELMLWSRPIVFDWSRSITTDRFLLDDATEYEVDPCIGGAYDRSCIGTIGGEWHDPSAMEEGSVKFHDDGQFYTVRVLQESFEEYLVRDFEEQIVDPEYMELQTQNDLENAGYVTITPSFDWRKWGEGDSQFLVLNANLIESLRAHVLVTFKKHVHERGYFVDQRTGNRVYPRNFEIWKTFELPFANADKASIWDEYRDDNLPREKRSMRATFQEYLDRLIISVVGDYSAYELVNHVIHNAIYNFDPSGNVHSGMSCGVQLPEALSSKVRAQ